MKIQYFERNEKDEIVAVGDKKIILSFEFVATHKPAVGDEIIESEDGVLFGGVPIPTVLELAIEKQSAEETIAEHVPESPIEIAETLTMEDVNSVVNDNLVI